MRREKPRCSLPINRIAKPFVCFSNLASERGHIATTGVRASAMTGVWGRCLDRCSSSWLTLARQPSPTSLHQPPGPGIPACLGPRPDRRLPAHELVMPDLDRPLCPRRAWLWGLGPPHPPLCWSDFENCVSVPAGEQGAHLLLRAALVLFQKTLNSELCVSASQPRSFWSLSQILLLSFFLFKTKN